jgi:hypothetical protein
MRGKVSAALGASAPGVIPGDNGQRTRFLVLDLRGSAMQAGHHVAHRVWPRGGRVPDQVRRGGARMLDDAAPSRFGQQPVTQTA